MPTILALETSTELASVALFHRDRLLMHEITGAKTHSTTVLPTIHTLLEQAGISLRQCDAIGFGAGPGSFTGVRTACAMAQGLAFGAAMPVVPVVTLLAMACAARELGGEDNLLVTLDARMGEVYWAQYRFDKGWIAVQDPTLSLPAMVTAPGAQVICGNAMNAYGSSFSAELQGLPSRSDMPHAAAVATLARDAFVRGERLNPRDAQPLYLRNKIALTTAERLEKAGA